MSQTTAITAINLACGKPSCPYSGEEKVIASVNMDGFTGADAELLNQYAESGLAALSANEVSRLKVLLGGHLAGCPLHGEAMLGYRATFMTKVEEVFTLE